MPEVPSIIAPWSNFYVIIGGSSASLTGLMFIVITLVAGVDQARKRPGGISMFSTPTVVHFCAAFFTSATLSAPWPSLVQPAGFIGVTGASAVVYMVWLAYRIKRQEIYRPDLEDWAWYTILPLVAYGTLAVGAILLVSIPIDALFVLAGATTFLVFIGIRNAWDVVTYVGLRLPDQELPPPS
jgi:hypothetical protein